MLPSCPDLGPPEGWGEVATSDFFPVHDTESPLEGRGYVVILPRFGPNLVPPPIEHRDPRAGQGYVAIFPTLGISDLPPS